MCLKRIIGYLIHIIGYLFHIMEGLIKLFYMSLMTKQWLNKMNTMKHHLLMLSNNMRIVERDFQIICHNYALNRKGLNLLMTSYTSIMPILLRTTKKKVKCYQLKNGISVTKFHFVTYWVWMIMRHSGTWRAKGEICFQADGKSQFQVGFMSLMKLTQNKAFKEQFGKLVLC